VRALRADGGAAANAFLVQFQADLLGLPVEVAAERETTALGAAALAGLGVGLWRDSAEVRTLLPPGAVYEPRMSRDEAETLREGWRLAVRRTLMQ
jgi:glycerol kinase